MKKVKLQQIKVNSFIIPLNLSAANKLRGGSDNKPITTEG